LTTQTVNQSTFDFHEEEKTMDGVTLAHVAGLGGMAGAVCIGIAALLRQRSASPKKVVQPAMKRTRLARTFAAHDIRGRIVTLSLYQQYFDAGTRDNLVAERLGPTHILTPDGRRVEKIGTLKYRILGSRDILSSDDANAP
jgi:hypothetical protein